MRTIMQRATRVIGGLIAFGIIGLFIGPVVLAVAHMLLVAWASESNPSICRTGTVIARTQ